MAIKHHLDTATLMSCASGSQPEPLAGVIVAHLSVCATCRSELRALSDLGQALFASLPPTAMTGGVPDPARLFGGEGMSSSVAAGGRRAVAADDLAALAWTDVAPGLRYTPLPLSSHVRGDLGLIEVAPGAPLPEHVLAVCDLAYVVAGSYRCGDQHFAVGDVAELTVLGRHPAQADDVAGCVCIVASQTADIYREHVSGLASRALDGGSRDTHA